jgi:GH35 family endo-1,4-beta-xylanase
MEKLNKYKLFVNRIYHIIFCEKFYKSINFQFEKNVHRWDIINEIINKKNLHHT